MTKSERKSRRLIVAIAQAQAMSGDQARLALTALLNAGCVSLKSFERARLLTEHPLVTAALANEDEPASHVELRTYDQTDPAR